MARYLSFAEQHRSPAGAWSTEAVWVRGVGEERAHRSPPGDLNARKAEGGTLRVVALGSVLAGDARGAMAAARQLVE